MSTAYQRYRFGGWNSTPWAGYCEYNSTTQQYRYFNTEKQSVPMFGWTPLSLKDLQDLLVKGAWMHDVPVDQQLPEGF